MSRTRPRLLVALLATCAAGCGILFDFGDYDGSRPDPSNGEGGVTVDGAPVPPRSFVVSVEPTTVNGTTGDRTPITIRVTRGELFTEEVALSIAPGQDVALEAPVIAQGATESRGTVIPGNAHGVKVVTIVGTAPSGTSSSTTLRIDVRGRPGTLDNSFAKGGVLEEPGIALGVDVVTVDGDRIVVATNETRVGITADAHTIARYTESGALDVTFGTGGRAQVVPPTGGNGGTQCIARGDATGSILVGGTTGEKNLLLLTLVDANGKTITTFGTDGTVSTGQADCRSLAVAKGGAIVLAAATFLQRRLPSGAIDPAWGDAGEIPFTQPTEALTGALTEDGGAVRAFGLFKSWSISPTGARGVEVTHAPPLSGCAVANRPARATTGQTIMGGTCGGFGPGTVARPIIGVLDGDAPNGKFGAQGFVYGPAPGNGSAVVGAPGGFVRVSGTNKPSRMSAVMYDASGNIVWSFDGTSTPALDDAEVLAATVDSRGRIVIVGYREPPTKATQLLLVRLWP